MRSILELAEEDVAQRLGAFPMNLKVMLIPSLCPLLCVMVNTMEKEVMQEPNMLGQTGI
jgi:hypothetical protein